MREIKAERKCPKRQPKNYTWPEEHEATAFWVGFNSEEGGIRTTPAAQTGGNNQTRRKYWGWSRE